MSVSHNQQRTSRSAPRSLPPTQTPTVNPRADQPKREASYVSNLCNSFGLFSSHSDQRSNISSNASPEGKVQWDFNGEIQKCREKIEQFEAEIKKLPSDTNLSNQKSNHAPQKKIQWNFYELVKVQREDLEKLESEIKKLPSDTNLSEIKKDIKQLQRDIRIFDRKFHDQKPTHLKLETSEPYDQQIKKLNIKILKKRSRRNKKKTKEALTNIDQILHVKSFTFNDSKKIDLTHDIEKFKGFIKQFKKLQKAEVTQETNEEIKSLRLQIQIFLDELGDKLDIPCPDTHQNNLRQMANRPPARMSVEAQIDAEHTGLYEI